MFQFLSPVGNSSPLSILYRVCRLGTTSKERRGEWRGGKGRGEGTQGRREGEGKFSLNLYAGNGQPGEPALCQLYRHTFVQFMCRERRGEERRNSE